MAIAAVTLIILATLTAGYQLRHMTTRPRIRALIAAAIAFAASYATYLVSPRG